MREKPIISILEEIRCYIMRILARNKKALVEITLVQHSRLKVEKRDSNRWRLFPTGDLAGNIFEVYYLPIKVSVDLGKKTCNCIFWQLNGLLCRQACAALFNLFLAMSFEKSMAMQTFCLQHTRGRAKNQHRRETKGVMHQSHNYILTESSKNMG
ncbi:hypothetical protein Ahy_B04g073285 [Arachis hypogaea]|uniref:SWIM-type domain-containing protein n=1 Tax=Arachis hypogaea TaxID=3818 RepID=A0A444ZQ63_ARAHY|nr:hypothetical protein Ahy_B04g073285 [Arachis hypogaea]